MGVCISLKFTNMVGYNGPRNLDAERGWNKIYSCYNKPMQQDAMMILDQMLRKPEDDEDLGGSAPAPI
jgi:hypothetical protein